MDDLRQMAVKALTNSEDEADRMVAADMLEEVGAAGEAEALRGGDPVLLSRGVVLRLVLMKAKRGEYVRRVRVETAEGKELCILAWSAPVPLRPLRARLADFLIRYSWWAYKYAKEGVKRRTEFAESCRPFRNNFWVVLATKAEEKALAALSRPGRKAGARQ